MDKDLEKNQPEVAAEVAAAPAAEVDEEKVVKSALAILDKAIAMTQTLEKADVYAEDQEFKAEPAPFPGQAMGAAMEKDEEEDKADAHEKEAEADREHAEAEDEKAEADKDEDEDEDEDEDKDEDDDEALKSEFAAIKAKLEKRGLLAPEPPAAPAPTLAKSDTEELKKSFDERFSTLEKNIEKLAGTVEKLAKQPIPRRGVSGAQPLRKSDEGEESNVFSKSEVIEKLFELKKSGDPRVTTQLITKVDMGKLDARDFKTLNSILG